MKTLITAVAALALGSSWALAQEATTATAPAPAAETETTAPATEEPDPGEEVICRRQRATGSLTRRVEICMTRNEWNTTSRRSGEAHSATGRAASGGVQCRPDPMGGC
ncbi:MAG: hypothetical protein JY451_13930 [Erythrobacter sp.]|nr:MAG: hypothetical protein JY451_13930 [Erythrobacter sp.]